MEERLYLRAIFAAVLLAVVAQAGLLLGGQRSAPTPNTSMMVSKLAAGAPTDSATPIDATRSSVEVGRSVKNDTSIPLREMKSKPFAGQIADEVEMPDLPVRPQIKDPVVQNSFGPDGIGLDIPAPGASFDGISNQWGVYPPDTNGDVGPNHYVQTVNLGFRVFNKAGMPLTPVMNTNTLWSGFGGVCEATNRGDPIVNYDPIADRWVISQFAFNSTSTGPYSLGLLATHVLLACRAGKF